MLASSPGNGFCFRFLIKLPKRILARIATHQSQSMYSSKGVGQQVGRCQSKLRISGSKLGWLSFFVCGKLTFFVGAMYVVTGVKHVFDGSLGVV